MRALFLGACSLRVPTAAITRELASGFDRGGRYFGIDLI